MRLGMVWHRNFIEEEINESYQKHPDVPEGFPGRMIFCKKLHKITEPLVDDCSGCSYFAGLMGGYGHECAWEDVLDDKQINGYRTILWTERKEEMHRVLNLIADGILEKG